MLDASVLVAAALPNEPFHADAKALMQRLMNEGAYVYLPAIAFAEVAAAIARGAGDEQLALAVVAQYSIRPDLHRVAVDAALGDLTAEIAAKQRIRGCDAVYVALALRGASRSGDTRWSAARTGAIRRHCLFAGSGAGGVVPAMTPTAPSTHALPAQPQAPATDTPAERLARGGGWWTLILALLMLLAVTESLNTAAWSDGLVVVRYAIFGGALLAFALALTRWDGLFPAVYGFLASLFWVATCFNWFIFRELSPQAGTQELLHRNWEWLLALLTGSASADNLIFVTQLALLGWWIGYLALWSLIRHQRLLHAVLPAGLALIVNAYFAPQNMTGFIILYLVAVLLLAIRIELARNETALAASRASAMRRTSRWISCAPG